MGVRWDGQGEDPGHYRHSAEPMEPGRPCYWCVVVLAAIGVVGIAVGFLLVLGS